MEGGSNVVAIGIRIKPTTILLNTITSSFTIHIIRKPVCIVNLILFFLCVQTVFNSNEERKRERERGTTTSWPPLMDLFADEVVGCRFFFYRWGKGDHQDLVSSLYDKFILNSHGFVFSLNECIRNMFMKRLVCVFGRYTENEINANRLSFPFSLCVLSKFQPKCNK